MDPRPPRPPLAGRGCRDWRATLRPTPEGTRHMVPLPADALDEGLSEFARTGGLTRRDLLERGVGLWLAAGAVGALSSRRVLEAAAAQQAQDPQATILVSLYLGGGNDGLDTLVPLVDRDYPRMRSRIGITPADALPLLDTADFGWHPALGPLRALYDQGKVAVLPAVDYAHPDQSHFQSAAYWRRGIVGQSHELTGWLGRTLDAVGSRDNPLQGIGVDWSPDPVLVSRRAPSATVYDPGNVGFWIKGVWDDDGFARAYADANTPSAGAGTLNAVRSAYRNAFQIERRLRPLRVDEDHPAPAVPEEYPDSHLGRGLRNLARMLGAGFGTRVATLTHGGFDTHEDQGWAHEALLGDLARSLYAFQADLTQRGLARRVLTMVWSEFGRRPQDNESRGTDHGAGGLLLLVGDRANGGIRSEFPGLARLDEDDNLLVTTEFRTVYASLLEQWLGVEAARILPGIGAARLPLVV
ncbi:MAG TPA: DUF1501 domain-containing protein [Miltoncostaeaceae bacterium]|nr:DUF1501 domain-containing protein [Miltoncostaeaceae bacterium]